MQGTVAIRFRQTIAAMVMVALTAPAMASVVSDLEGSRAAGALDQMDQRGYVQTSSYQADGGSYTYWWNKSSKTCVRLLTRDGKIAATKTTTAPDCGQKAGSGSGDGAAAVIAGAAIIAGIAALSHKSHHRNDQEYADSQSYAEFERGHRDGLLGHPYNNYNRADRYNEGYDSGVRERGQQSSYRGSSYYGRTAQPVSVYVDDLNGARAAGALSDLESRGFRSVDRFQSGNDGAGTVWWNGQSRQCIQIITVDGHIDSLTHIDNHPRCR